MVAGSVAFIEEVGLHLCRCGVEEHNIRPQVTSHRLARLQDRALNLSWRLKLTSFDTALPPPRCTSPELTGLLKIISSSLLPTEGLHFFSVAV